MNNYKFWFVVGSQFLYGPEALAEVEKNGRAIVEGLNNSNNLPFEIIYKTTIKTSTETKEIVSVLIRTKIVQVLLLLPYIQSSKMWINGLNLLQSHGYTFILSLIEKSPMKKLIWAI